MPRCPRCKRSFRTLDDEVGMHDCPRCGFGPGDDWPPLSEEEIDARIEADRIAREYDEQRAALDWAEEDRADEAYDVREAGND